MKPEQAAKLVSKKLRGWTPVSGATFTDGITKPASKVSASPDVLIRKYRKITADAAPGPLKFKHNGVSIVTVRSKKSSQDTPGFTKSVVVGDKGIIGMQG